MRIPSLRCMLLLIGVLLPTGLLAQWANPNTNNFDYNPVPFNTNAASPSSHIMWGLSQAGQKWLSHSNQNSAQFIVNLAKGKLTGSPGNTSPNKSPVFLARQGLGNCGVQFGTKFNLEPSTGDTGTILPSLLGYNLPLPQDEEAVDFIPNAGLGGSDVIVEGHNDYRGFFGALNFSVTGLTVHVQNAGASPDCTPSYEMGVPQVLSPLGDGQVLLGFGDPIVKANPTNGNIYAGGLQFGFSDTAVGVFKTTAATLNSCQPLGTTNEGDSTACLPVNTMVNTQNAFSAFTFNDKPDMAVDERPSGTGAGDVYVTDTLFNFFTGTSEIGLEVCNAGLSACSPFNIVSDTTENGGIPTDQFSNIKVRPDGGISITYVNFVLTLSPSFVFVQTDFIKYISCTPNGAPAFPTCNAAQLVATETTPLGFGGNLASNLFRVDTYPTHDNRNDTRGTETYIVWSHCNQHQTATLAFPFVGACANADLMYAFANTTGNPAAPSWTVASFDTSAGDQYMPWVRTDAAKSTVNIDYYTGSDDPQYRHQYKITLAQIAPGTDTPKLNVGPAILSVDPSGDFNFQNLFIGDYVGVAARGGTAYLAYTYNEDPGVLPDGTNNGASTTLTEENNHLRLVRY